jgi:predicted lipid carrier protein YhbT
MCELELNVSGCRAGKSTTNFLPKACLSTNFFLAKFVGFARSRILEAPMVTNLTEHVGLPKSMRRLFPPFAGLPLGPLLTLSLRSLARRRPALFERLAEHSTARYLIDPTDLSFAFHVVPDGKSSIVRVTPKSGMAACDVVIRGPLLMLLGILDGTLDGDALFFHRTISVSGRTEAVVALRNAIEDAELRPSDLLGLQGMLARFADAGILGGLGAVRYLAQSAPTRQGGPA